MPHQSRCGAWCHGSQEYLIEARSEPLYAPDGRVTQDPINRKYHVASVNRPGAIRGGHLAYRGEHLKTMGLRTEFELLQG